MCAREEMRVFNCARPASSLTRSEGRSVCLTDLYSSGRWGRTCKINVSSVTMLVTVVHKRLVTFYRSTIIKSTHEYWTNINYLQTEHC